MKTIEKRKYTEDFYFPEFSESVYVKNVLFEKSLILDNMINGGLSLYSCHFKGNVVTTILFVRGDFLIENCVFDDSVFLMSNISGNVIFKNNIFKNGLEFCDSVFKKNLVFENNTIYGETDILKANEPRGGVPHIRGEFIFEGNKLLAY